MSDHISDYNRGLLGMPPDPSRGTNSAFQQGMADSAQSSSNAAEQPQGDLVNYDLPAPQVKRPDLSTQTPPMPWPPNSKNPYAHCASYDDIQKVMRWEEREERYRLMKLAAEQSADLNAAKRGDWVKQQAQAEIAFRAGKQEQGYRWLVEIAKNPTQPHDKKMELALRYFKDSKSWSRSPKTEITKHALEAAYRLDGPRTFYFDYKLTRAFPEILNKQYPEVSSILTAGNAGDPQACLDGGLAFLSKGSPELNSFFYHGPHSIFTGLAQILELSKYSGLNKTLHFEAAWHLHHTSLLPNFSTKEKTTRIFLQSAKSATRINYSRSLENIAGTDIDLFSDCKKYQSFDEYLNALIDQYWENIQQTEKIRIEYARHFTLLGKDQLGEVDSAKEEFLTRTYL